MKARSTFAALGVCAVAGLGLVACDQPSTLARPTAPVVLTGADVPALSGVAPGRVVAFRQVIGEDTRTWEQIPVQVDQRKVVAFGSQPGDNESAGTTGTVYGNGSGGPTALQYADANTWVGADTNPDVDADDEITFMGFDAGARVNEVSGEPAGVVAGSGTEVRVDDPRGEAERGWVYLFRSTGGLDPAAGEDYVDYQFELTSGDYKTTYRRANGPNPETSSVTTSSYEIGFSDRWIEDSWKVRASGASGVDILDGVKNQFSTNYCGRSNQTFADAEGAFVANIDGPVRAIRSYVGANSGPLTQRTHIMYRDREDVTTNLRVHSIGGVMDFVDYSASATGMSYRNSKNTAGVTIDGNPDAISTAVPKWEVVNGPQGRVYSKVRFSSSVSSVEAGAQGFYRDEGSPSDEQCWGDGSYLGASGTNLTVPIPNTDPRTSPSATVTGVRITQFLPPIANTANLAPYADDWSRDLDAPLTTTVAAYQP